ncbi:MAG TPA: MFS transporter [Rhizomicrobium sp.]|nr:MFS transporter [Rhizomicrobium sp.]
MAFLHNRTVNLLNLHYVIASIAQGGGGAFFSVYLLKSGMSVPAVLVALAIIFASRLAIRTFLLPLAIRIGLRPTVIVGTFLMALSYPFLIGVHGVGPALFWLILVSATADTVYWPSYHAYFAALGDEDHRGQQLGLREAVAATLGIVSPIVAGWLLVGFGPAVAFTASGAIQAVSAIPLFWTPDVPVARHAPGGFRAAVSGAMLFIGDGWVAAGYFIVWQIALFLALDQSYLAYGGALAVAALVGAVGGLVLGRLIDSGKGARAVWYSLSLLILLILMRAGVLRYPWLAVTANALGSLVGCLYIPTMMTAVYNQAKRSPCVMRFHIAAEGGWDVGVSTGLMLAALLIWFGYSMAFGILLSLGGAASVFVLLRRYYADHAAETVDAALSAGEFQIQPGETLKV